MIKSMTGFGRGKCQIDGYDMLVEIKTVNHRYCDIYIKMPRHLNFMEEKIREYVGKSVSRGKIEVWVSCEEYLDESREVVVDSVLVRKYVQAVESIRDNYKVRDDISVSLISRFPDVMKIQKKEQDEEKMWSILKNALEESLHSLVNMRQNEGKALMDSMLEKADNIRMIVGEIEKRAPEITREYRNRLESRLKEIIEQQIIDENRIALEIAIFADRCSVDEEIVRLKSHLDQFASIIKTGDSVGRKLDFLVQEFNREVNTIGSKANDIQITRNIVEAKSEVEKIREQIQNIE